MGDDDDRPFACTEPNCSMRFANEDHLSVHKMKHEMSLSLNPGGKSTANLLFVDQTPTPTKFLKNCEEIGLFSELNKNPFEEAFKKAADTASDVKAESLSIPGAENETLHTPTPNVLPAMQKVSPLARITESMQENPAPPASLAIPTITVQPASSASLAPLPGPSSELQSTISPDAETVLLSKPRMTHDLIKPSTLELGSPTRSQTLILPPKKAMLANTRKRESELREADGEDSIPDSPILAMNHKMPRMSAGTPQSLASPSSQSSQLLQLQPSPSPAPADPAKSASAQYLLQVMIQMPNGDLVPVHIPAAVASQQVSQAPPTSVQLSSTQPSMVAKPNGSIAVTTTTSSSPTISGLASSSTKQKLKAAIQQNSMQNNPSSILSFLSNSKQVDAATKSNPQKSQMIGNAVPIKIDRSPSQLSSQMSTMSSDSENSSMAFEDEASSMRRRTSTETDDPDDRRKKFLERNRAAAARCRQKKKAWIGNLETKAEELQATNIKLQNEVTMLKGEVAQLKALLLAHKDCPITLQQQAANQLKIHAVHGLETQSDSISSTSQNTVSIEAQVTSSPEAIATSALASMATKHTSGHQATAYTIMTIPATTSSSKS